MAIKMKRDTAESKKGTLKRKSHESEKKNIKRTKTENVPVKSSSSKKMQKTLTQPDEKCGKKLNVSKKVVKNKESGKSKHSENKVSHKRICNNDKEESKPKFTKQFKHGVKKKPNWLEFKKKKKELKKTRREQANPKYDITIQSKKIWEAVRNHKCPKEKRDQLVQKLHSTLKGHLSSIIHSHDMARIVQCILKFGNKEICSTVCQELLPHIVGIMLSKYACYCIKPLFVYNDTNYRIQMIDRLIGSVVKLLNHCIASRWLEYTYNSWASQSQKLKMRQELYGNLFKLSKDETVNNLEDLFSKNLQVKPAVLSTIKAVLDKAMEKKHIMVSSLLHSVLLDYTNHCDSTERTELLESLVESLLQLLTSRDGTNVAMKIVWYGTNKTKKTLIKMLKTHIKEVSELEHGHLLLLALFDSVDDTVLIKKVLFPELIGVAEEMANDEVGRRVLLHLTAHRDKLYFHPAEIQLLEHGDEVGTSKKDASLKHKELLSGIINNLLSFIASNPSYWLDNSSISMLMLAILKNSADGSVEKLKEAHSAVASIIVSEDNTKIVEDARHHLVFKKILQHDKNLVNSSTFSSALVNLLTESVLTNWVKVNRACFLLVGIIESGDESAANELTSKLTKNIKNILQSESSAGAKVLFKKFQK